MQESANITQLMAAAGAGDSSATNELFALVYDELRAMAGSFFRQQAPGHTLQPTALVHDAYLRLVKQPDVQWENRAHFFAVAARAMRQILINHARDRRRAKRGGDWQKITLSDADVATPPPDIDLLALDEAMTALEQLDERQCRIVELRFFGGLSVEEAAHVLDISPRTVKSDWAMARAWLFTQLIPGESS